jgi:hypothetical protein
VTVFGVRSSSLCAWGWWSSATRRGGWSFFVICGVAFIVLYRRRYSTMKATPQITKNDQPPLRVALLHHPHAHRLELRTPNTVTATPPPPSPRLPPSHEGRVQGSPRSPPRETPLLMVTLVILYPVSRLNPTPCDRNFFAIFASLVPSKQEAVIL